MIERVLNEKDASVCDQLLNELILDEKQYNSNIDEKFIVKDYFKNVMYDNILLSYKENNMIIGYIFIKNIMCDDKNGYLIDGLFVKKEYRNKGISKKLINEAFKYMNGDGFIEVNAMFENEIAKKIYKSFGFKEFKIQYRKNI